MERIEKGRLVGWRCRGVDAELDAVAEQRRLVEVLEPEGRGIRADLGCDICKIDDAGVMAFQAQLGRVDPEPQIDGVDRNVAYRLEFGRKLATDREETGRGQRLEDDRANPLVESGMGGAKIGLNDTRNQHRK